MNFTQNKPETTKISLGEFRITNGKLEELVVHIQHKKIGETEHFCKEIWEEITFGQTEFNFEPYLDGAICIFTDTESRKVLFKYGEYFIDGKGFVCASANVFLNSGSVKSEKIFVTIHGYRTRAKI